jgi:hypothetical protein
VIEVEGQVQDGRELGLEIVLAPLWRTRADEFAGLDHQHVADVKTERVADELGIDAPGVDLVRSVSPVISPPVPRPASPSSRFSRLASVLRSKSSTLRGWRWSHSGAAPARVRSRRGWPRRRPPGRLDQAPERGRQALRSPSRNPRRQPGPAARCRAWHVLAIAQLVHRSRRGGSRWGGSRCGSPTAGVVTSSNEPPVLACCPEPTTPELLAGSGR